MLRFDQNTPPLPLASTRPGDGRRRTRTRQRLPGAAATAPLRRAIADYAGVEPENVVLGAGADDLILLCARAYAGPATRSRSPRAPTYPLYRIAAELAGAEVGGADPVLTFACRPNNPTGELGPLPDARPLVVDEAYFEYSGVTALDLLDDEDVIVLRTFSKLFGLAGARVGYALARARHRRRAERAAGAGARSRTLSADAGGRCARRAARPAPRDRGAGAARFGAARARASLRSSRTRTSSTSRSTTGSRSATRSCARASSCRAYPEAIRASVRDAADDDLLVEALARVLDRPSPVAPAGRRVARTVRATAETRFATRLALDGASRVRVATGAGLYDHFLEQLAFHAGFDLVLEGAGDLETGDHHTAEDAALALGAALDAALGDRRGIARYGDAVVPMDDALARAAVDLGGRAHSELEARARSRASRRTCSRASRRRRARRSTSRRPGRDAHHVAEAAFKAVGRALRAAVRLESAGAAVDEGRPVKVAICEYGAGNVR